MVIQNPFQQNGRPGFIADVTSREHVLAGGAKVDAADFVSADAVRVSVTAGASADDTSVAVAALSAAIPAGTALDFGGKKFARLSAGAAKGATTLAVDALASALTGSELAYYNPPGSRKRIPAGTLVGLTHAELEGAGALSDGVPVGVLWGRAADGDDVVRLTVRDVVDADANNDVDLLRSGTLVYVNHIPNWDTLSPALKTKVRATYELTTGGTEV